MGLFFNYHDIQALLTRDREEDGVCSVLALSRALEGRPQGDLKNQYPELGEAINQSDVWTVES